MNRRDARQAPRAGGDEDEILGSPTTLAHQLPDSNSRRPPAPRRIIPSQRPTQIPNPKPSADGQHPARHQTPAAPLLYAAPAAEAEDCCLTFARVYLIWRRLDWEEGALWRRFGEMLGSGLNLVTTVIGFGMSATFIVFVCARLICGRAARADADAAADAGADAAAPAMAQPPAPFDFDIDFGTADLERTIEHSRSGLDPFAVAAIPTVMYTSESFHSKDDAQCSICLGEYKEKEILRIMPTCRHNFHLECIDVWLEKQITCPICRISLKDVPGAKATPSPRRSLPQLLGRPENSVNRSPHWILPIHRDRTGGRQNSPVSQETLEVMIEIQPHIP